MDNPCFVDLRAFEKEANNFSEQEIFQKLGELDQKYSDDKLYYVKLTDR